MANPVAAFYDSSPLCLALAAFWDMLEAHTAFTLLVPANNRIKYQSLELPDHDVLGPADFPRVIVIPTNIMPHPLRTSNGSSMTVRWEIRILTGGQRLDLELFPVIFAIYAALADWITQLTAVTWNAKAFIINARQSEVAMTNEAEPGLMLQGWVGAWAGETELWFTTSDLAYP